MLTVTTNSPYCKMLRRNLDRYMRDERRRIRDTIVLTVVLSVVMPIFVLATCEHFGVHFYYESGHTIWTPWLLPEQQHGDLLYFVPEKRFGQELEWNAVRPAPGL